MNKNTILGGLAAGLFAFSGVTLAQTVTFGTPTPAQGPAGTVFTVPVNFTAGGGVAAYQVDVAIPAQFTNVTPTNADGVCAIGNPQAGAFRVSDFDGALNPLASGTICNLSVTIVAATPNGTYNFSTCNTGACQAPTASDGGGGAVGAFSVNYGAGFIVGAAPLNPTTVNFNPTTASPTNGGNPVGGTSAAAIIGVTTTGGTDPGSYSCTVPAGFQLTNAAANNLAPNSDPADISVTCTLAAGASQASSTCTRTGGANVTLTLNCPAGQPAVTPNLTATPVNGTALTCNGPAGSTITTGIQIQNTGTGPTAGLACSTVGAGFSVTQQPAPIVAANGATSATVSCVVPAQGATINGTLNCSAANGGGALSFPVSSTGQAPIVAPSQPSTIPSTSLWAKIGLIGLIAALGLLMVGFRRHS